MILDNLLGLASEAETAADRYETVAREAVRKLIAPAGKVDPKLLEREQFAAHGFAWIATYVAAIRQMRRWAEAGAGGELEHLILQVALGEYLAQLKGGIAISQVEIVRPADLGANASALDAPAVWKLIAANTSGARLRVAELIADGLDTGDFGALGLGDEAMEEVRRQFRRFVDTEVGPHAHGWHLRDELIPLPVVQQMADLGVFGLTVPEEWGGLGMGKLAMCVVTEELSRGYIGVGSLGTRSEIAAELIRAGGTEDQKKRYLSRIASGELLPTAVFTEPNTGSDLASLRTRAVLDGDSYKINGNKTWITHAARADIMTLLARSDASKPGYQGLSMFLAEKPRGDEADPFPAKGMSGGEIKVLGYRGMKEYEIGFDGFEVPAANLLGGKEGQGFKQLMATFESARIQTAARAVGVAQNALELGLRYARDRIQFAKPLYAFPRVAGKIAWMAVETMIARQLTYFAAREKDQDRRCDIEAGMAKLLAARVASG
jgi:(2S)-methylsuccinyl-CoA dehydrogenase